MQTDFDGNDGNPDGNDSNLTSNEALVLKILTAQPDLSAAKIAVKIGISKPSVERVLRSLKGKRFHSQRRLYMRQVGHFKIKVVVECQESIRKQD